MLILKSLHSLTKLSSLSISFKPLINIDNKLQTLNLHDLTRHSYLLNVSPLFYSSSRITFQKIELWASTNLVLMPAYFDDHLA